MPRDPVVLWRYPRSGGLCSRSEDEYGTETWCGVGWTGQPNVLPRSGGGWDIRFGAYDDHYHFLDGATGEPVRPDLVTAISPRARPRRIPTATLYYAGSPAKKSARGSERSPPRSASSARSSASRPTTPAMPGV